MTLQIKGVQIAGLPATMLRDVLRRVSERIFTAAYLAEKCNVSARRANEIIQVLVSHGYIEFSERSRYLVAAYNPATEKPRYRYANYYRLTDKGDKLTQGSAMGKMPRAKAKQIIAGLLKRVEEVNSTAEYMFRIPTVIVYGSYVRGEPLVSDVDIALEWEAKWSVGTSVEQFQALRDKRVAAAEAKGKQFFSWFDRAEWYRREVWLQLKAKTRGLSLHEMSDFVGMRKDDRFAYQVLLGDAGKVTEQLTKHKVSK